ncbi:putative Dihydroorotase [Vibrio nigripulchritudo SFn27]|uniref:Putative Dihydroorotase n=1 Tax=Vibrio nigripulchritudo TaxID=28173 RepID=U4KIN5_9VIBR|nr:dihydroorotase [Vibrio nigripulchritudo]CCN81596.1 putative Dihydroorotase [Vibrio nigripulchritudo BLFn1]CCN91693.1 putative Dihydroorotase [Vibrio nigripulchritudo SFn27]CCN96577.1 putative Dihydroorotase [Vibrio nigripulchritudo ENn2]CCO38451.1 putative Dihydroorotase [Vibrio nigripulchritudo SFn135]CCO53908.1 putative Dihydroorotase [Vibrio nigripulchritudo Wn13]
MSATLIKNARVVNEGTITETDLRIVDQRIEKIEADITAQPSDNIVDAKGAYLLPGMIDDQVHFREPGLTHKGSIATESRAAVAGGITSYMEMPNVNPATTTIEALEKKYAIAAQNSVANYSFYLGATEDNLEQIKRLDPKNHCGVKVFMGASTGDLLVEHPQALDAIFRDAPVLIVTHCESGPVISKNREQLLSKKPVFTIEDHPVLRDDEACFASSSYAVDLAKKYQSQLHVLHITTAKELALFESGPIQNKHITAEACVHHLWFSNQDYATLGNQIKCNPAIKYQSDRDALIQALHTNQIDIIATDHAPHTWEEKQVDYNQAPAGLPLVQHALLTLLDHVHHGRMNIEQVVEKTAHNPAIRYAIQDRGFIREGYFADLVLVDAQTSTKVTSEHILYHCEWSPFKGHEFTSRIKNTWVNGGLVYANDSLIDVQSPAMRMSFDR